MCRRADESLMSDERTSAEADGEADANADSNGTVNAGADPVANTPGRGRTPEPERIEPAAPEAFGLVQVWWGDGKGKTTATLGMGVRAAGHGYRVHMLQFMKGGASSVDAVRGEYNAIAALPGISYENLGHYGWHGMADGSDEEDHEAQAQAGLERARELLAAAGEADLETPFPLDGPADEGVHMLILDEVLYAADRGLITEDDVLELIEEKPADLELVLSGSHSEPSYLEERADLITNVRKEKHPIDAGQRARRGTEF
ncbi:cob(I)yrinic acid a,c-diamide adenosyltransferase [Halopiger xanaduensis]|uniref:ATP:corrinoid adenosyltransferase BtuR/CobO/CobP n=1 Tax=Halopiger xanaduensis (strain DSM 18323 / JCM 14033 / SH-6) TaxID=797210 RepID=F8D6P9_HALXS|nr:cob(I)yrinic acid a,c-diamide adenosyltransferase [Halopiger xanaduensis]AEH37791.1 ATP:corrinoid adenosyltransferase BtuR/CobO/CobP [Halopiger xanaduensis SH-6]